MVIVNLGGTGLFLESEKDHKIEYDFYSNEKYSGRLQIFPTGIDYTQAFKNYKDVKYQDRNGQYKIEMVSMVDFCARIPNCGQNILLLLEVAHMRSDEYRRYKKEENRDY